MRTSRPSTSARLAVALAVLATTAVSSPVPADAATCTPTTRTIETKTYSDALLLGPRGHVLATEADAGATSSLWLHNPDGTAERVAAVNAASPDGPRDVSAKGYVIGTDRHPGVFAPYTPWVYGLGDYWTIPLPADASDDYLAVALNHAGATVGVHTNARRASPAQTGYFSRPQLWPTLGSLPVTLPLPHSGYYVVGGVGRPLIDIRADGRISAVVDDHAGTRYLARWKDPSAQPSLVQLPSGFELGDVAGRWVIGISYLTPSAGRAVIWSPTSATQLIASIGRFIDVGVTANGTYATTLSVEQNGASALNSLIGRGGAVPGDAQAAGLQVDVQQAAHGQLLLDGNNEVSVVACALNLPDSSEVTVSAWP